VETPHGYRQLEGSECRPRPGAVRIGAAAPGAVVRAVIRLNAAAGASGRRRVEAFAVAQELHVSQLGGGEEIVIMGTVAQINVAFGIEIGLYTWAGQTYRGFEGFAYLPAELAGLVAELAGLLEAEAGLGGPWRTGPGSTEPGGGGAGDHRPGGTKPIGVTMDWTVPHPGPSGPVDPGSFAFVSSFDIDWLTSTGPDGSSGFGVLLANLAASPGAFQTVRVMKAMNSGTAEIGSTVTGIVPPADSVWAYQAPPSQISFADTIAALTELTKRGLTPFVVLGFFPDGVYSGTMGGLPNGQSAPYGPDQIYLQNNPDDWETILGNWGTLVQAFFTQIQETFHAAIEKWWFEVWNEPDNPSFWQPSAADATPLQRYCDLYQATVSAIAAVGLRGKVQVGGPAVMANTYELPSPSGMANDLSTALSAFLPFVYGGGSTAGQSLQCDFISFHAKGDWTGLLPSLQDVIDTTESAVKQYTSDPQYGGYFDGKPIINDEADMRVGAGTPYYPRMTSQFPAWLMALTIACDSLSSEYRPNGAQFISGSDNAHLELVGWQPPATTGPGSMSGAYTFGQQRSIMMAASQWNAGTVEAPWCPADLVKVPVYNFYEFLRLLGNQHGVFISGQQNFYPTDPSSDLFSAITVGVQAGVATHVCWVFCVYPPAIPASGPAPQSWSFNLEVLDLPADWTGVNWVQFLIGSAGDGLPDSSSFLVAQNEAGAHAEPEPAVGPNSTGVYQPPTSPTMLSLGSLTPADIRMAQEVPLVQYMTDYQTTGNAWQSRAPITFEPFSTTMIWITRYDPDTAPATPSPASYILPDGSTELIQVAARVPGSQNVVLTWQYPPDDPNFFYFRVTRDGILISPEPAPTTTGHPARSFALRAGTWVDTGAGDEAHTYTITAVSASGKPGSPLAASLP
jgi:Glycosyl hydrolases family 39